MRRNKQIPYASDTEPMNVWNAVHAKRTVNPKTVLAFYATVLGILLGATVTAVAILAKAHVREDLIPWLLGFAAIMVLALVMGVFIVTIIDPSKLMLTQVTGTEYAAIQRHVVVGDSATGERIGLEPGALSGIIDVNDPPALLAAAASDEAQEASS